MSRDGGGTQQASQAPWKRHHTVFTNAKAGMDGVDKDHVQRVVYEMSKVPPRLCPQLCRTQIPRRKRQEGGQPCRRKPMFAMSQINLLQHYGTIPQN